MSEPRPGSPVWHRLNGKTAAHMSQEQFDTLAAVFPLGRIGQPDDIAQAAVSLLSDHASWITGVTLDINGGKVII
jgi:3-oxoacyl-[acyl-carrier protein] reductase